MLACSDARLVGQKVLIQLPHELAGAPPFHLSGHGNFRIPRPGDPGGFNERAWFQREGWAGRILLRGRYHIDHLPLSGSQQLRQGLQDYVYRKRWPPFQKRLALALLFGEGRGLTDADRLPFARTGTAHVLAVSGLHVGMVYVLVALLTRFIPEIRWRLWVHCILSVFVLFGYSWLTGFSPSVVRSALMFGGWALSASLERSRFSLNGLWLAALISLMLKPVWIFSAGFHLSYAAVAAILIGIRKWTLPEDWPLWKRRVMTMVLVTLFAQAGTLAIGLYYFELFPVYFLPANLIFTPLVPILLYGSWGSILLDISGLIQLEQWWTYGWMQFATWYRFGLEWLSGLPGAVIEGKPGLYGLICIGTTLWLILLRVRQSQIILWVIVEILTWRVLKFVL